MGFTIPPRNRLGIEAVENYKDMQQFNTFIVN